MASDPTLEKDSILAAELALRLLDGADLDAARRREREDPDFAREVRRWAEHFGDLFDAWPSVEPSEALRRRVLAAAGIGGANDNRATPWKWATAISGSVAAALALVLLVRQPEPIAPAGPTPSTAPTPPASLAVAFAVNEGAQTLPATLDMNRHQVRVPAGLDVPAGRVAQLWLIEGQSAPKPLGLFEKTANGLAATITLDRAIPAGAVLAISIEPPGGSPTGLPTGPVVATGELKPV